MAQADTPHNPTRNDRRGSFGRTFSKLKDAVRRRSLGGRKSTSQEESSTVPMAESSLPIRSTESAEAATTAPGTIDQPVDAGTSVMDKRDPTEDLLVVDEDAADDDTPTGPLHSLRYRGAHSKAKALFEKYGIKYEEGAKDDTDGSTRVEKAIRIRIHWQCHECKTGFSGRKTCTKCGHRRCKECPRAPAKRVKEMLGGTAVMEEIEEKAEKASAERDDIVVPIATSQDGAAAPAAAAVADKAVEDEGGEGEEGGVAQDAIPEIEAEGTLEKEDIGADGEVDVTQFQYSMQTRPRAGIQLVLLPKASYIRRSCHECKTNFTPASRQKCLNCGHDRCDQCPRERAKPDTAASGDATAAKGAQQWVGTVERVYKKPRQRIRWACHECHTFFIGRADCSKCGHARCEKCPRSPVAKVAPAEPDPAVLASVAEKLAKLRAAPSDSEPIVIPPETATAAAR